MSIFKKLFAVVIFSACATTAWSDSSSSSSCRSVNGVTTCTGTSTGGGSACFSIMGTTYCVVNGQIVIRR